VGAVARYLLDRAVPQPVSGFPTGILVINLTGAFALGLLYGLTERAAVPIEWRTPLGAGFLGAYTTFSTWTVDSWRLIAAGELGLAALNLGGSLVLGMALAGLGLALSRL